MKEGLRVKVGGARFRFGFGALLISLWRRLLWRRLVGCAAPRRRSSRSQPPIWSSSSSISARLAVTVDAQGSGSCRRSSRQRPPAPNRSRCGLGSPCWKRIACAPFFSALRCLTRWSRKRARSRSARTRGPGSHTSGTRLRRASSASTQQSIRSRLAGKRRQPTRLHRIGDPDIPAAELELIVHEYNTDGPPFVARQQRAEHHPAFDVY
jgi:hypothetical protein